MKNSGKGFKYRIYPNKKQKEIIAKTFGCCWFVYNTYLAKHSKSLSSISSDTFSLIKSNTEFVVFSLSTLFSLITSVLLFTFSFSYLDSSMYSFK